MASNNDSIGERVDSNFPVGKDGNGNIVSRSDVGYENTEPSYREHQRKTIRKLVAGFEKKGKDVMLLNAPTGSGKSLILHALSKTLNTTDPGHDSKDELRDFASQMGDSSDVPEPLGSGTFFTTPLNALVDQIEHDPFVTDEVITLKGRNNYDCIHPKDSGTAVNEAICQREDNFDCEYKTSCPYYGRKYEALQHPNVVTNMSYLMAEGMIPGAVQGTFANRDLLIVDECQKLEDFAMNFVSFTISSRTVPNQVWNNITIPRQYNTEWADDNEEIEDDWEFLTGWLEDEVLQATSEMIGYLDSQPMLSNQQNNDLENLKQFEMRVENFLDDVEENDWISQIHVDIRKNASNDIKIVFKPVEIGRFLENLLWNRADWIVLSSATIPRGGWLEEVNLTSRSIGQVTVPSTFPVENRPIKTDLAVGKMTYNEREENAWPMAQRIKQIAEYHDGKGMVHCRSYSIAEMLEMSFHNHKADGNNPFDENPSEWFEDNVMMQDSDRREESLEEWQQSDKQVFFSVAMDEGVSLDGDACRWQVLAKTLYKNMSDKRVKFRVQERGEWDWYNRHAAIQIQQAYGRAVRGPDDWAVFYVLDKSAVTLIDRNEDLFEDWFLEALNPE